MQPINVSKSLATASSTSIGSISTANGGTVTLSCATLDTARRITVTSASLSGPVYTITGLTSALTVISETITPSTTVGSAATTTQDFYKVTSITLSCAITNSSGGFLIGTNTQGGTPWQVIDNTRNPQNVGFFVQITSPATTVAVSFEYSFDYPAYDPRTGLWAGIPTNSGPRAIISTLGSTVTSSATVGTLTTPAQSWRITLTSTSSAAGSATAVVTQSG